MTGVRQFYQLFFLRFEIYVDMYTLLEGPHTNFES
jgi:hypothetical protein